MSRSSALRAEGLWQSTMSSCGEGHLSCWATWARRLPWLGFGPSSQPLRGLGQRVVAPTRA
eukprot:3830714-Alexandrium_andersonii.AAC.1